ncbi:MAG: hypothetical protein C5B50_12610 [Verrucomicrobia bacterium]|nr:MAG: hypothetical protein C5B50_12610 [Verrucomicrobiota bacterium]
MAGLGLLLATGCKSPESGSNHAAQGVSISEFTNRLRVEINGRLFTEYFFKDVPRPYCYPIIGPGGTEMTRNWPMKNVPGEEHDHPHHRSLWFGHGLINGQDFWSEVKGAGKTVHEKFVKIKSGRDVGIIRSRNKWVSAEGDVVCADDRSLIFRNTDRPDEQILDFEITFHASNGDIIFGDTKEGSMAIRVAETMKLGRKKGLGQAAQTSPSGHIVTSAGDRDDKAWGKRAEWCDYSGPVDGQVIGIAIFDHPKNPRHPTWWHVRDYGLFAANPFGKHDFEKLSDNTAGDLDVPAGKNIRFRYRFFFHKGDSVEGGVAEKYREWVGK